MADTIITNPAALITIVALWSFLSGMTVYLFMAFKQTEMREEMEVMDYHLNQYAEVIEDLERQLRGDENEVVRMIDEWS